MTRRSLVRVLGTLGVLAAAGCTAGTVDKTEDTDTDTDSTVDSDLPLVAPTLHWENDAPTTVDDLAVVVDDRVAGWTYIFQWLEGGVPRGEFGGDERVPATATVKGQLWKVRVAAQSANGDTPFGELETTIANSPPVTTLSIEPGAPRSTDSLVATPSTLDADGDEVTYRVSWTVDSGTGPQSAGFANQLTVPSSAVHKGETWRATVTPDDGQDEGQPVVASVDVGNGLPLVSTAQLSPTEVRTDGTLRATIQRSDPDGDTPLTDTIVWYVDGNVVQTGGTMLTGALFARGNDVWFEATTNDGTESSTPPRESNHVFVLNTPASITSVVLSPTTADETTTLTCTPQGWSDLDGDAPGYVYAWQVGGRPVTGVTSSTLTGANFNRNDPVTCTAAPDDGTEVGPALLSNQVTIGNTLPTMASALLTPASPTVASTLQVQPMGGVDLDGDTITYTYAWYVEGALVPSVNGPSLTAGVSGFTAGDHIYVEATPRDSFGPGGMVTSNEVVVANTPPTVDTVTLTPNPAYTDSVLLAVGQASDPDGDHVTLRYVWKVNTVTVRTEVDLDGDGDTLDLEPYVKGDDVVVFVTPNDGTVDGTARSVTRRISNTVPSITGVEVTPTDPVETSTLHCTPVGWSDADGEVPGYRYVWRVSSRVLSTANDFINGADFHKGDVITCQVFPDDGEAEGAPVTSAPVTVRNTPPVLASATLSSTGPRHGDTLSVTLGASSDVDGDTVTFHYTWEVDGVAVSNAPTLSSDSWAPGQIIHCIVAPYDGEVEGTPVTSNDAVGVNTLPTISSFSLTPTTPRTADTLQTSLATVDTDGDELEVSYVWYRNNVVVPGAVLSSLDPGFTTRGDLIRVAVTVTDPYNGRATAEAGPVLVVNTLPTLTGALVTPGTITEADTATCEPVGWHDDDGDLPDYDFQWKVDGTFGPTGPTLTGASFNKGNAIACRVWPKDGDPSGRGAPVDSGVVVVGNMLPVLDSVAILPGDPVEGSTLTLDLGAVTDLDPLDTVTLTYAWTVNDVFVSSDDRLTGAVFDEGDSVVVTVTPYDTTDPGLPVTSAPVVIGNTAPRVLNVSLSPGAPSIVDTITAMALVEDVDTDDVVEVSYTWYVGTDPVAGVTGDSLDPSHFTTGDRIHVVVVADDGDAQSDPFPSANVVIGNAAPSITDVVITPAEIREGVTATCEPHGWFDPDGDPPGYEYTWLINGTPRAATATITGIAFNKRDVLVCRVRPYDGAAFGDPVSSDPVTVVNSPPTLTTARLSTNPAREQSTLSIVVTGQRDADGDTLTVSRRWLVNGSEVSTATTLTGALFNRGDTVQGEITLDDTEATATYLTDIANVVNTNPQITSLVLTPAQPRVTQDITATPTYVDADGDEVTYTYTWYVAGAVVPGQTGPVLPAGSFVKHDEIYAVAVANDTFGNSNPASSNILTAVNSPPVATDVSFTPSPVSESTPPTCQAGGGFDADGDPITMTWRWQVGGQNTTTSQLLANTLYQRGQTLQCFAIPYDGEAFGAAEGSQVEQVINSAPTIASVLLDPSTVRTADAVRAVINGQGDLDGDVVTWTVAWFVNGVQVQTGTVLDPSRTRRDDRIVAVATPNDGRTDGTPVSSAEVVVQNTRPRVTGFVEVLPLDAYTEDTLSVEVSTEDDDGDTVVLDVAWTVAGTVVQTGTSLELGPDNFVKGDTISVTITPYDGIENGNPVNGLHGAILNTAPRAPTITVTPAIAIPNVDNLVCAIDTPAFDADGDAVTYTFAWRQGTVEIDVGLIQTATSSTVPAGLPGRGETWVCEARASDGLSSSPWSPEVAVDIGGNIQFSCQDYRDGGYTNSGIYRVDPDGQTGQEPDYGTYCDQATAGGGWSRILRTTGQDHDLGQRSFPVLTSTASNLADVGAYPAFSRDEDFDQIMIKQVSGQQAGAYAVFDLVDAPGRSMLDVMTYCRDQGTAPNNDSAFGGARTLGHTTAYSGTRIEGDLMIHPSDGSAARPVAYVFLCGVNTSSDNDVAYLSFSDATGTSNDWGDSWRGNGQKGTIWSFANGDYALGTAAHIGHSTLQALAGWKGTAGTPSGDQHAGTYEIYVR
ncbi:MAG: hypothetical protein H6733_14190 [Alphaproteobacteria bacterium]|nr:hypothetical protein [Alphaproteobacteria bacterium]